MTCARRLAGAHRPAPSAGSPSKPDARPGRRCARLSLLLPALALLLGALSLFNAAPAQAQTVTLVSNHGQTTDGNSADANGYVNAQAFTTGANTGGYALHSIEAVIESHPQQPLNDARRAQVRAELWSASGGAPDAKVADLTVPTGFTAGTVAFAAPTGTTLDASTTYFFLLYTTGTFSLRIDYATATGQTGESGWSVADARLWRSGQTPGAGSWYQTNNQALRIAVKGPAPLSAPTGLTAFVVGGTGLDLTWTAPSEGRVTGYDVHYTSASTDDVANDADAVGITPSAAWVDARHSGTLAWHSIAGLTKGTTYRVRVRSTNPGSASGWLHGTQAVPLTVPGPVTHLNAEEATGRLALAWHAPPDTGGSAITGYDVHFTGSQDVPADKPAVSGQPGTHDWAPHYSGTNRQHTISGLNNGNPIRVRVRAKNAQGAGGPWVHGSGTPRATNPPRLTGLTLAVGTTNIPLVPATFYGGYKNYTATVPHDASNVTVSRNGPPPGRSPLMRVHGMRADCQLPAKPLSLIRRLGDRGSGLRAATRRSTSPYAAAAGIPAPPTPPTRSPSAAIPRRRGAVCAAQRAGDAGRRQADAHLGRADVLGRLDAEEDIGPLEALLGGRILVGQGVVGPSKKEIIVGPAGTGVDLTGTQREGPAAHTVANGNAYDLRIAALSQKPGTDGSVPAEQLLYSDWVEVSGTPAAQTVAPPTVPRNVAATAGDGKVTLAWQAPSSWGGLTPDRFEFLWKLSSAPDSGWFTVTDSSTSSYRDPRTH